MGCDLPNVLRRRGVIEVRGGVVEAEVEFLAGEESFATLEILYRRALGRLRWGL